MHCTTTHSATFGATTGNVAMHRPMVHCAAMRSAIKVAPGAGMSYGPCMAVALHTKIM